VAALVAARSLVAARAARDAGMEDAMKNFALRQRVQVIPGGDAMDGRIGTVARLRMADDGAWVQMDNDLPADLCAFPDPADELHRHIVLYPEQCQEVTG
jgi:hypothetical protein